MTGCHARENRILTDLRRDLEVFLRLHTPAPRPLFSFAEIDLKTFPTWDFPERINMDFTNSLDSFIAASPWLSEEHEPEVAALRFIADSLDNNTPMNPAPLISQWGLLLRSLRKQAPAGDGPEDPLEAALRAAEGQA